MNEFDTAVAEATQSSQAQAARFGYAVAQDTNPDAYAEAKRVAQRTGVPVDTALALPNEMKRQANMGTIDFDSLARTSPATAMLLADIDKAKLAHDNVENLSNIEQTLGFLKDSGKALVSGIYGANAGIVGGVEAGTDFLSKYVTGPLVGSVLPEDVFGKISYSLDAYRKSIEALQKDWSPKADGIMASGWYSGLSSLSQNMINLPLAMASGNPELALGPMVAQVFGQSYGQAKDKGLGVGEAINFAASQAAIEYATEKFPVSWLVKDLKAGSPLWKTMLHQMATEVPGEQAATALQDLNEWAALNPEKPFSAYWNERPSAAAQTLIATLVGTGGQVSIMHGVDTAIRIATGQERKAEQAESAFNLLARLNRLVAADKVVARDADTFEGFINQATEDGPVGQVFIDANTLMQSGLAEQVAAVSPAVSQQLPVALATGGQIAIPTGEYAARIAPTEFAQPLLDHIKIDPDGFSRAEAQQYMQSHGEALRAEVERTLAEKEGDDAFKQSAEAVRTNIKGQLDAAARFTPQVNDAYAAMVGNFYAVMAARASTTPEALYQRYPLKIGAEAITGQQFEQALASQPPAGWAHSTTGEDAAKLWNGEGDARAVFWTDLQGKLSEDSPAISGYSHSISTDAISHIKNRHGDAGQHLSGQVPITGRDIALIPEIVTSYDAIRTDLKGAQGQPAVAYAKQIGDGVVIYLENASSKRQNLSGVSMWKIASDKAPADLLQSVLDGNAKGQGNPGLLDAALRSLSDYESDAQTPASGQSIDQGDGQHNQGGGTPRGSFNPSTLQITLLKNADLSTFLHESGHFFLEVMADLAGREGAPTSIQQDMDALFKWFGIKDLAEWQSLEFEEKRSYHEQFARGFEAYLFEGNAPNIEMQGVFQRFRAWLLNVYKSLKSLNVELTDEVRGVFDRMVASTEQITLAEQGRSMMPLFTSAEQAGMTVEEFAKYHAQGIDATNEAVQELQSKGLRDMQWIHNARGRIIKKLQKEAAGLRAEATMAARREVMSQPIYRAWSFLTGKLAAEDKIEAPAKRTSSPDSVDETQDSLFAAIAKLGGLDRKAVQSQWGIDPKERIPMPAFGKHVLRREGGLGIDSMAEALSQYGYLTLDEHGKLDLRQLEDKFFEELRGNPQHSVAYDYSADMETRAGDQVVNPQALGAGRFDIGELKAMGLSTEVINAVQARRMTAANGLHPDIVAEMFGFTSGDELVRALASADDPKTVIEAVTDTHMLEEHGELSSPEAIARSADAAIHNDVRARMVATEANALAKATGKPKVLAAAAKAFARSMVARLKIRNIKPGQYANAEVRSAKAAAKASKAGDVALAAAEKRNQLINTYATRAAYDAQDEVVAALRYLNKFEGDIKGLDAEYAEQIANLLERFDLRKGQSLKAIDKRTSLAKWMQAQEEAGILPDIPAELADEAFRTSYKNMTLEEFRGLVDAVKQIEHLGRLKHKLLTAADHRAYEAVRDEIVASINAHAQGREADTRTPTTNLGRAVSGLKRFWASHIKAATWARIMDGNKDGGPMWEYFIRNANERGDMETSLRAEATAKLSEILGPVFALGKMGGSGQCFPSIKRSLNREARIAIALNMGNEGNMQRLLGGEGWTQAQIQPVLASLTATEWHAVQAVWDHLESYRPLIAAKERRVYGKEPAWVVPMPFSITTADGQSLDMRGGYYPIKYDPAASQRAEEHASAEDAKRQLQGAYTSATTRRSFTKARVEEVEGRPLLYSLSGVYSGVNDVIHDLAWHEWLIDVNRLLRSSSIDNAIRSQYGPEVKQQFKSWTQDIAEGDRGAQSAVDTAIGRLRQGVSAAGLGFNVVSAFMQPLGITQSMVRVGTGWIARGVTKYLAGPIDLTREVNQKSDFMANRSRTRFRELNELRNRVQDQSAFKEITGRYAYFLMMRFQQMVDVPTWWGAYEKAIAEGNGEDRAISLADQAVIDSQGGGETKDLSAIERGGPAQKIFTVFYSFMNTALNLGVMQTMGADTPAKKAKVAADYLMLYIIPPILGYFLKAALTPGDAGDDDPEKLARKLIAQEIDYLMGLMVVVREFSEAAKLAAGANDLGRGYEGPAGIRIIADTMKFGTQVKQGEFDDAFRKATVNLVGDAFGLPSAQVNRTITGAEALSSGETSNPASLVFGFQKPH